MDKINHHLSLKDPVPNNREINLRRQKSINVPISKNNHLNLNKCPSTPSPVRSTFSGHSPKYSPRSVDYEMFKNRNDSSDQGETMQFLQVSSPTRSWLPHQYSAESTESAASCLSGVSSTSHEMLPIDHFIRSTSETSTTSSQQKTSHEKLGLWPTFKKIIKEKKRPTFKKRKAEVRESYTDPVYHLLKCGANPNHNRYVCQCDCHQKSEQLNERL